MDPIYRLLLAIGNAEIEDEIKNVPDVSVIDSDPDIGIITDILDYETVDYVIVNTILSEEKSLELAKRAREKLTKVIAIVKSHQDKELVAALVGFGVKAFVQFDEIQRIDDYIRSYPDSFDFGKLQEKRADSGSGCGPRTAGIRERIFRSGSKKGGSRVIAGCRVIGVIGASAGTGASSLCVGYATYLKGQGKKALLLDRTENRHLSSIEIKGQKIDSCLLSEVNLSKYEYIIIDFGRLAEIDTKGNVSPGPDMTNEKRLERQFCNEIILVGSSLPWKLIEIETYIEHTIFARLSENWILYITGEQNRPFELLKKNYEGQRAFIVSYELEDPFAKLNECIAMGRS